ncbi:MAG: Fic family protein [Acidobacteria bacterium]|nr:Fic family protein [Acidobacteriota bacterium]
MHSLSPGYLQDLSFTPAQVSTLRALGEYRGKQELYEKQRPETLEALRTVAIVESTDSSNRLEGITAPKARLEALVGHSTTPRNRSEQEIAGYRDALELIHQARRDMPFSVNIIRQLHQTIYSYLPEEGGKWKNVDNEIVERNPRGEITRIRFRAVAAAMTPETMEEMVRRYRDALARAHDPLVLIPLTVLDFLCIHPFRDGNGRVARLLTLLLLYHAGYDVGRYVSLERLFEESRESYYETLEMSSRAWHEGKHDWRPWNDYFWGVLNRAYTIFEERVGSVESFKGSKSQRVREAVERKMIPFGISEIETECPDVSRETIRNVLQSLRDQGVLEVIGRGRGARWRKKSEE